MLLCSARRRWRACWRTTCSRTGWQRRSRWVRGGGGCFVCFVPRCGWLAGRAAVCSWVALPTCCGDWWWRADGVGGGAPGWLAGAADPHGAGLQHHDGAQGRERGAWARVGWPRGGDSWKWRGLGMRSVMAVVQQSLLSCSCVILWTFAHAAPPMPSCYAVPVGGRPLGAALRFTHLLCCAVAPAGRGP